MIKISKAIVFSILLFSCSFIAEEKTLVVDENTVTKEVSIEEDFEVLKEQVNELSNYQLAVRKHEESNVFPETLVLQANDELYNKEGLNFQLIVKTLDEFFIVEYRTYATEVENVYYITFDYNGNQLDAALVNTFAVDLDGEIIFTNDTTFQVNRTIKDVVWEEADIVEVGDSEKDTIYYRLTNKGIIIKN